MNKKMKPELTEKIRAEFNRLREKGVLFKALAYGTPDYIEESREIFTEYAASEKIPLAEAFETIDNANTHNDFSYTQLKYKVFEGYRENNPQLDNEVLVNFAAELVGALAVEDLDNMLTQYEQMLVGIGKSAIKPLQDFIATEGKDLAREQGSLYPVKGNYDAAKRAMSKILGS